MNIEIFQYFRFSNIVCADFRHECLCVEWVSNMIMLVVFGEPDACIVYVTVRRFVSVNAERRSGRISMHACVIN